MKGLFRSGGTSDYRKELDERGVIVSEDKGRKHDRASGGGDNINAFLGEGTSFKGNLTFEGTVRIDGRLEGEIFTKDTLVVGKEAQIKADVHAGTLVVGGTIRGNVTAEKRVDLQTTARLFGNISTPSLIIAEGVVFEGACSMGADKEKGESKKPAPAAAAPSPAKETQKLPA